MPPTACQFPALFYIQIQKLTNSPQMERLACPHMKCHLLSTMMVSLTVLIAHLAMTITSLPLLTDLKLMIVQQLKHASRPLMMTLHQLTFHRVLIPAVRVIQVDVHVLAMCMNLNCSGRHSSNRCCFLFLQKPNKIKHRNE